LVQEKSPEVFNQKIIEHCYVTILVSLPVTSPAIPP